MTSITPEKPAERRPLRAVWGPVTIRVAWTLYQAGLEPTKQLTAAREHVLLSLPTTLHANQAEELAEHFTVEFIQRLRNGNYRPREIESCGIEPQYRWRTALITTLWYTVLNAAATH